MDRKLLTCLLLLALLQVAAARKCGTYDIAFARTDGEELLPLEEDELCDGFSEMVLRDELVASVAAGWKEWKG
uniref:Uncharacterized protein n=1 Tax=Ciona intestinalis TaxID=7719 RepID=F7B6P5_CIOIN